MKNDLLAQYDRRILWLSKTYDGSVHDKKICDEQPLNLPDYINLWQDTGFLGHLPQNVNVIMPTKKPKGRDLTEEQKQQNKEISSFRVIVEHAIGGAKRCRIIKDTYRCHKLFFEDTVMMLACGLHNFRITMITNAIAI